ncbi:MAG: prenyltransferase [Candidatus Woesearchaeota archaeon]
MDIKRIIKMSRPRFWLYLAGTFMVGYAYGINDVSSLLQPSFIIPFLIFLIPANIFVYGINDIADREMDKNNPKKDDNKESAVRKGEEKTIAITVWASLIIMITGLMFYTDITGMILLAVFIILGAGYSLKPLRLKEKPFLDFLSNSFYIIPGIIGYYIASNSVPPMIIWLMGISWTGAMHLYSAIPDIIPDKKSGIMTAATVLGHKNSLLYCSLLWSLFVLSLIILEVHIILLLASLTYVIIPLILMFMPQESVTRAYWKYPYINAFIGMLFFLNAVLMII